MTEADVQQLVEQNPTDPVLKALSASLQRRSGKIREVLVLLESGLASYEAFPERLYLLWKTYDNQLGNHQKGESFVRRLLEVDPLNDRATGLGYSNLDEETLRHINFIKSLEDLPDSIFAIVLPVRELENLIGTTKADALDITPLTLCEQRTAAALEKTFTLPGISQQPQVPEPEAPPQVSPAVASLMTEEPAVPSQPVMAHMTSMLEQAQLIARDLRPTPAPAPMSHVPVKASPEVVRTSTPESAAKESSPVSSVPQPTTTTIREPVPVAESGAGLTSCGRPSQPAAPAHVTMRYANSLLEDSRFEEALQAFLELSHKN
jgi:tetratricopeptide (TPR) repeat protein